MIFGLTQLERQERAVTHACQRLEQRPGRSRLVTVLLAPNAADRLAGWCSRCGLGWEARDGVQ